MTNPSLRACEAGVAIQNWIASSHSTPRNDGLVFIPGWGFHASVMQPLAEQFSNQTIHYADLPLIEDDRQTFQTIVEKLNASLPANSTLVAWSLGGLFAIALCASYPEKYKKLILLASISKFTHAHAQNFLFEAGKDLPHLMKHFLRLVCFPSKSKFLRLHLEKHVIHHEASLRFYLKLLFETDLTSEFGKLTQPVLRVIGEKDVIVQSSNADVVIANGGHGFFLDPADKPRDDGATKMLSSRVPQQPSRVRQQSSRVRQQPSRVPEQSSRGLSAGSIIQSSFNKAAKTYDQYSRLQQHIGKKLIALLPKKNLTNIIDLGCGTGTTTAHLADAIQFKKFYAIDIADILLTLAGNRLAHLPINIKKVDFAQLANLQLEFDLAFSNMALHWSHDLETTFKKIASRLNKDGLIAFSLPLQGTFKELENNFSVNSQASKEQIVQFLKNANYNIISHQQETHRLKFNSTLETLRSIKNIGATHVTNRKYKSLLSKSFLQNKIITELTYEIGYFIAKKAN